VYTAFLAEKLPNIRSYTLYIYGSGQLEVHVFWEFVLPPLDFCSTATFLAYSTPFLHASSMQDFFDGNPAGMQPVDRSRANLLHTVCTHTHVKSRTTDRACASLFISRAPRSSMTMASPSQNSDSTSCV